MDDLHKYLESYYPSEDEKTNFNTIILESEVNKIIPANREKIDDSFSKIFDFSKMQALDQK